MSKRTKKILIFLIILMITIGILTFMFLFNDETRCVINLFLILLGSFSLGDLIGKLYQGITNDL